MKLQTLWQNVRMIVFQLKEFLFSLVSEEKCRLCNRKILNKLQIMHYALGLKTDVFPAVLHNWCQSKPQYSRTICSECWQGVSTQAPMLGSFERGGDLEFAVISGASYEKEVRKLIHLFKFKNDRLLLTDLAAITLRGWRMASVFVEEGEAVIVPVPLHWWRKFKRGFNQSELIAHEIAKVLSIPVSKNALRRCRSTTPQQKLEKMDRMNNIKGAFSCRSKCVKGKVVVLVDDICTSGATLSECAQEVIASGASRVVALTVARTVLRKDCNLTANSSVTRNYKERLD